MQLEGWQIAEREAEPAYAGVTTPVADAAMMFAICVHKFPEGLALGSLLLGGGYERKKMLWLVVLVESTTILGGLLGWVVLQHIPLSALRLTLSLLLANAAGGFFYLAVHAVFGEILKHLIQRCLIV